MKLLKINIARMFSSVQFYIAVLIMLLSSGLTYYTNYTYFQLGNRLYVGALNKFIFSNIFDSVALKILAPLISVLPLVDTLFDDFRNGFIKNILTRIAPRKYYMCQIATASISGGFVFVCVFCIQMIVFTIIEAEPAMLLLPPNGLYHLLYSKSLLLFCLYYIFHCFVYGTVFGLFGCGIALNVTNRFYVYAIPTLFYYLASSIHQYIPGLIIPEALYYILPIELFDYQNTLVSVGNRLSQYVIMIVVSFILIITGLKKRRKGFNLG